MSRVLPRARGRRAAGFTLVEIMVAMVIMIFGVMSIVRLQAQTMRNTTRAREVGTATQLAQTAIERLKLDAHTWTAQGTLIPPTLGNPNVLGNTAWLQYVGTNNFTWMTFAYPEATMGVAAGYNLTAGPAADFYGRDLPDTNTTNRHYCTSMRLGWVHFGRSIRADVRVYWRREQPSSGVNNVMPANCAEPGMGLLDPGGARASDYHFVYLSTVIPMREIK